MRSSALPQNPVFPLLVFGPLSLVGKTFGQATAEGRRGGLPVIGIVAFHFAGEQHMKTVMDIIVPLCRVPARTALLALEITGLVGSVYEDEMHVPLPARSVPDGFGELGQNVRP